MSDLKTCSRCRKAKDVKDYYMCAGKQRSECKSCTINRNVRYQRRVKAWKHRYVDDDTRRLYQRQYYSKNKERFARYRSEFRARYPEYYKHYFARMKENRCR